VFPIGVLSCLEHSFAFAIGVYLNLFSNRERVQPQTHGLLEFSFVCNRHCLILLSNRGGSHFKLWTITCYSNSIAFPTGAGQECGPILIGETSKMSPTDMKGNQNVQLNTLTYDVSHTKRPSFGYSDGGVGSQFFLYIVLYNYASSHHTNKR
jgi:hypothetical protein